MKTADEYGGRLGRADLDDIDGLHASIRRRNRHSVRPLFTRSHALGNAER